MKDAGIPFRNLTMAEVDRLLAALRQGATVAALVQSAAFLRLQPSEIRAFVERNPEAVRAARLSRVAVSRGSVQR